MGRADTDAISHAADLIGGADALVIAAGAGMGVDSGLPDFRGDAGFWKAYPALGRARLNFMQVASPSTFVRDPALAWGFYGHRLSMYRDTVPHPGFEILRRWSRSMSFGSAIFTSNVDGQFQRAGFSGNVVTECHGSIHWLQCSQPCDDAIWAADDVHPLIDPDACRWIGEVPRCPRCAAVARPNILMFGDAACLEDRMARQEARLASWLERVRRPVVVELGAGVHIPSVRQFSEQMIHDHHGRLVRINLREYSVPTRLDVGLACGAFEGLRAIDAAMGA